MKVFSTNSPWVWKSGALVDVNRANDNWAYLDQACQDVFDRRYAYSVVQFPFFNDVDGYGVSSSSSQESRRFRISPSESISIVGLFLDGGLTSSNAEATLKLVDVNTDAAPAGVPTPIFTIDECTSEAGTQHFGQEIPLAAGSTYAFQIDGYGYATDQLVLTAHFRSDRFNTAGTDTRQVPSITYYTEADQASAANWTANDTAIAAAVTANAAKVSAQKPMLFVLNNFADGYDSDLRRWDIPRVDSSKFRCNVVRIQAFAEYASAGSGLDSVTWTLQDNNGTTTALEAKCTMDGVSFASGSDTSPAVNLATATTGVSSIASSDYRLVVTNNSSINCVKSYCWVWIE